MLCSSASLPGSALASVDVVGNYQGVVERFAHTRNFTQISLEFYVDNKYKTLKFLEHWMEYIGGANPNSAATSSYHFKMRYPELYKSNETKIVKFEKNYRQFIEYKFIGLFPLSLSSTRVSYQRSQVLKATCNFSYDRYICGESSSISINNGTDENKEPNGYVWKKSTNVPDSLSKGQFQNNGSTVSGQVALLNSPTGKADFVNLYDGSMDVSNPYKYFSV